MSEQTQKEIAEACDEIKELLIGKNKAYGDSAFNPVRIFSQASPLEQLDVRIDDKLSRFAKGHKYHNENDIDDLIGYLILKKIGAKRYAEKEEV